MKYAYTITEYWDNNLNLSLKHALLEFNGGVVAYVLSTINNSYLPYYIQEIEKILKGSRKEELEIHVTDDPSYDIPDDYIIVQKEWTFDPEKPEIKLETSELLEFLYIMAKELNIDLSKVVADESNKEVRKRYGLK